MHRIVSRSFLVPLIALLLSVTAWGVDTNAPPPIYAYDGVRSGSQRGHDELGIAPPNSTTNSIQPFEIGIHSFIRKQTHDYRLNRRTYEWKYDAATDQYTFTARTFREKTVRIPWLNKTVRIPGFWVEIDPKNRHVDHEWFSLNFVGQTYHTAVYQDELWGTAESVMTVTNPNMSKQTCVVTFYCERLKDTTFMADILVAPRDPKPTDVIIQQTMTLKPLETVTWPIKASEMLYYRAYKTTIVTNANN